MTVFIYALIDPMWLDIRYVGKTVNLRERLIAHCNVKDKTYRSNWIQNLVRNGMHPLQTILEVLNDNDDWQEREKYWISYFRGNRCNLVNCTDGGDGVLNISGEGKERMLKTWLGRKHKPETIEKLRLASTGRKHSDEWRLYMHNKLKGRIFSDEHKNKLKGKYFTLEHRKRISLGQAKLNIKQVKAIKHYLIMGIPMRKLANLFRVSQRTIFNIKWNKHYNLLVPSRKKNVEDLFSRNGIEVG